MIFTFWIHQQTREQVVTKRYIGTVIDTKELFAYPAEWDWFGVDYLFLGA